MVRTVVAPIYFVVGARPNFMKAAPVYEATAELDLELLLVHTGQHYDAASAAQVLVSVLEDTRELVAFPLRV